LPLEDDEQAAYDGWLLDQSAYVTDFGSTLTQGAEPDGEAKAEVWFNKSITPIYQVGLISADTNGKYGWHEGDTKDKCADCIRLDGQVHRLRGYVSRGWLPKSEKLACGGWECGCRILKTTDPISGGY
jgi:hypothetical protein